MHEITNDSNADLTISSEEVTQLPIIFEQVLESQKPEGTVAIRRGLLNERYVKALEERESLERQLADVRRELTGVRISIDNFKDQLLNDVYAGKLAGSTHEDIARALRANETKYTTKETQLVEAIKASEEYAVDNQERDAVFESREEIFRSAMGHLAIAKVQLDSLVDVPAVPSTFTYTLGLPIYDQSSIDVSKDPSKKTTNVEVIIPELVVTSKTLPEKDESVVEYKPRLPSEQLPSSLVPRLGRGPVKIKKGNR